eukprot:1055912-Amphidinium_carterae.1
MDHQVPAALSPHELLDSLQRYMEVGFAVVHYDYLGAHLHTAHYGDTTASYLLFASFGDANTIDIVYPVRSQEQFMLTYKDMTAALRHKGIRCPKGSSLCQLRARLQASDAPVSELSFSLPTPATPLAGHNHGELKVMQWNIDGVQSKKGDLQLLLTEHNPDVCVLSETWLTSKDTLRIPAYAVAHRLSRAHGVRGGGLAILTKENITFEHQRSYNTNGAHIVHFVAGKLSHTTHIVAAYCAPPSSKYQDSDENIVQSLRVMLPKADVLIGDLNCHMGLDMDDVPVDARGEAVLELLDDLHWYAHELGGPTRVIGGICSAPDYYCSPVATETDVQHRLIP